MISSADKFIERFTDDLLILLPNTFIAKEQASYMKFVKMSLKDKEFLVVCDFAENYAFIVQTLLQDFIGTIIQLLSIQW